MSIVSFVREWHGPGRGARRSCDNSSMEITQQCVVALTWKLQDTLGEDLDVLSEPVEFLVGGGDLLAKIEEVLQGHVAGDTLRLQLEPEDAFGDFDEELIFLEPRAMFPEVLEEGMSFDGLALPEGLNAEIPRDRMYTVTEIYPEHVVLDGNHPLAGIALRLTLTVNAVREADEDEISRGSAGTGFFKVQAAGPGGSTLH
jgi:FKBP-type peptidyl-prolyl cis-trans isomerase SlyD